MPDMTQLYIDACHSTGSCNKAVAADSIKPPGERAYGCQYFHEKYKHNDFRRLVLRLYEDMTEVLTVSGADAIVVQGTSGISVAFGMQMLGKVPLVMVRKEGEGSHGGKIEGNVREFRSYVFLDDFTSSGTTFRRVRDTLTRAECRGLWLHQSAANPHTRLTSGHSYLVDLPAWRYE